MCELVKYVRIMIEFNIVGIMEKGTGTNVMTYLVM